MYNIDIHKRNNLEKYKCTTIKCKGHESIYLYIPRSPVPVDKKERKLVKFVMSCIPLQYCNQ